MAGNSEAIDRVLNPKIYSDLDTLTEKTNITTNALALASKQALEFMAITGGSQSLKDFIKKQDASNIATQNFIKAQEGATIITLKRQQEEIKIANLIAKTTAAQEKQAAATQKQLSPYQQLSKELAKQQLTAKDLATTFGVLDPRASKAAESVAKLDERVKGIDKTVGQSQRNVGNYADGYTTAFDRAIDRATSLDKIGARIVSMFSRQLIGIGVGAISGIIGAKAIESLGEYISQLRIFNPLLTQAKLEQKDVNDALASTDYTKALTETEQLRINIDLANKGFLDKSKVVDEYNNSIGKVTGSLDTFNQVEQQINKNASTFIQITLLKATANLALAAAAEAEYKAAQIANTPLTPFGIDADKAKNGSFQGQAPAAIQKYYAGLHASAKARQDQEIADQHDQAKKQIDIATQKYNTIAELAKKAGINGLGGDLTGTGSGAAAVDQTAVNLKNDALERQKTNAQALIDDEKQSFKTRLKAVSDFYFASNAIEKNNEELALKTVGLSENQKKEIVDKYNNAVLQANKEQVAKEASLRDERSKQIEESAKLDIEARKKAAQLVIDNPLASFEDKNNANATFKGASDILVEQTRKRQVTDAGKNQYNIDIANKTAKAASLEVESEYQANVVKISKQTSEEIKKNLEDLLKTEKDIAEASINILAESNETRLQKLDDQRNKDTDSVTAKYEKGKITRKKYNDDLLAIDDQYNIDRLGQIAFFEQQKLAILQGKENSQVQDAQAIDASPEEIQAIKNNSGVAQQQKVVASAGIAIGNALNTQSQHQGKNKDDLKGKDAAVFIIENAQKLEEEGVKAINSAYEAQISLLEKKSQLITDNAAVEKDAIERSLATNTQKAKAEAILDAQTASQKKAITDQENALKVKQAKYDRALAIAQIIENTAVGAAKATGSVLGLPLVPVIIALGAAELAVVLSTPLPTFKDGGTTKGGGLIWGEVGTELAIEPGGKSYLSPDRATFTTMPSGTKIIPHDELIKPKRMNGYNSSSTSDRAVVEAINNNTNTLKKVFQSQKQPKINGWMCEAAAASDWANYAKRLSR